MRRGKMLALTAEDINFERRHAFIRDSKNGRSRKVPLSARATEVVQALMALGTERLLDLTANALKIGFFRRVLPAAGVEDFHFHDLRRESISRLAESGQFQMIELQAISGHRDTRMLQRYAYVFGQPGRQDEWGARRDQQALRPSRAGPCRDGGGGMGHTEGAGRDARRPDQEEGQGDCPVWGAGSERPR